MVMASEEEEEDYMSMAILEPTQPKHETNFQRRRRKELEAEQRGHNKSKKELEAEAAAAREAALSTSTLDSGSKGFKMMAKLGFKAGEGLGKQREGEEARLEPVGLEMKDDRGGIGMDTEKKRKVREEFEGQAKRVKADEGDFRERVAKEREGKRAEGMLHGAMKVAERMDTEETANPDGVTSATGEAPEHKPASLKSINVLWRSLARDRAEKERERRMRYDLMQSLSRNATYDDPEEDEQDRIALGKEEELLEEEDPELEEFLLLEPAEGLQKVVAYLRTTYNYCFWCKYRYSDSDMEGCPGITEEDHD